MRVNLKRLLSVFTVFVMVMSVAAVPMASAEESRKVTFSLEAGEWDTTASPAKVNVDVKMSIDSNDETFPIQSMNFDVKFDKNALKYSDYIEEDENEDTFIAPTEGKRPSYLEAQVSSADRSNENGVVSVVFSDSTNTYNITNGQTIIRLVFTAAQPVESELSFDAARAAAGYVTDAAQVYGVVASATAKTAVGGGGGGGGGGPVIPPTYAVNIAANIANGTVTADKTSAAENDSVTLTITPADKYELDRLTVDGNDVTASVSNNTYSFTMPAKDVAVSATFTAVETTPTTYAVTVASNIANGTVTADKATAAENDTVTLTVTPNANYELNTLTVAGTNEVATTKVSETQYTFVMPNEAVTVTATFQAASGGGGGGPVIPTTYAVNIAANIANGSVTGDKATAAENDTVTLTVAPVSNYELSALTVDGENVTASVSNGRYSFAMPAHDVSVTATFQAVSNTGSSDTTQPGDNTDTPSDEPPTPEGGCYVATSVYGSYDAPEVWTLRQYRDEVLGSTWYGRLFIKAYYATSPTLVKWFGDADWFQNFFRARLDQMVDGLQAEGFTSAPYEDINW